MSGMPIGYHPQSFLTTPKTPGTGDYVDLASRAPSTILLIGGWGRDSSGIAAGTGSTGPGRPSTAGTPTRKGRRRYRPIPGQPRHTRQQASCDHRRGRHTPRGDHHRRQRARHQQGRGPARRGTTGRGTPRRTPPTTPRPARGQGIRQRRHPGRLPQTTDRADHPATRTQTRQGPGQTAPRRGTEHRTTAPVPTFSHPLGTSPRPPRCPRIPRLRPDAEDGPQQRIRWRAEPRSFVLEGATPCPRPGRLDGLRLPDEEIRFWVPAAMRDQVTSSASQ